MRWPTDLVVVNQGFSVKHPGTDFGPPKPGQTGVRVFAPETCVVVASAYQMPVEGHYIILRGLVSGKFYYFGHFAERLVQVGRGLDEGTAIGIMGKTGLATGIHTHCEVRDERNSSFIGKTDPVKWFTENVKEGTEVMDDKDVTAIYLAAGKSEAEATKPENLNFWRGKKPEELAKALYKSQTADKFYYYAVNYVPDTNKLKAQLAACEASGGNMEEVGNNTGLFQKKKG